MKTKGQSILGSLRYQQFMKNHPLFLFLADGRFATFPVSEHNYDILPSSISPINYPEQVVKLIIYDDHAKSDIVTQNLLNVLESKKEFDHFTLLPKHMLMSVSGKTDKYQTSLGILAKVSGMHAFVGSNGTVVMYIKYAVQPPKNISIRVPKNVRTFAMLMNMENA